MTATSKPAVSAGERYWRWTLNLALAVTLARLLWLRFGNTDLYPDEAQYWLWSLHPALGYYSKPPLVAWLIALTTSVLGDGEASIRLAAPLLHFATSLVVYRIGARLYDPRAGFWAALAYVTLPGVSVSAALISTDAPLLLAWAAALYAFIRAREPGGRRWWILVGGAAGLGLLAKFAMAYWLISAALYIAFFAGERRHWKGYAGALALALVIYAPNFLWNLGHGFVSYRHTEENAVSHGPLLNPSHFAEFFFSQFGVFGPMFFACLLVIVLRPRRDLTPAPNALLAMFALPTLGMMLAVSFLSHAQPNWAAPAYVSAILLVAAWLLKQQRQAWLLAGIILNVAVVVAGFGAAPAARLLHLDLPVRYDPLHRLRGWRALGADVSQIMALHPGAMLLSDDREDLADLTYYVTPRPFEALKWNGESGKINDQFDLEADSSRYIGRDFLLVSHHPENIQRIVDRFGDAGPIDHIVIMLGGGESRAYTVRYLQDFKGYR